VKDKLFIVQLGSPKTPKTKDVRTYLRDFLGDPRVIDLNPFLWKIILYLFILPFRPKKSGKAYKRIWDEENKSFPLISITNEYAQKLSEKLDNIEVFSTFLISEPRLRHVIADQAGKSGIEQERWFIFPQFPQNCEATTSSVWDMVSMGMAKLPIMPELVWINQFHRSKAFIDSSVQVVQEALEKLKLEKKSVDVLLISFHGIPKRRIPQNNDPYFLHCMETYTLLKNHLKLGDIKLTFSFQSRFGTEEWLTPYTDEIVDELIENNQKHIAVYCPSFVVDCLETIDEIGNELKEQIEERGGQMHLIPCVNARPDWIERSSSYIKQRLDGVCTSELEYEKPLELEMSTVELKNEPLSKESKSILKVVFLTLFLDLVGFSIIFPMFPSLAKYYLELDPENFFLKSILDSISWMTGFFGAPSRISPIVLFGGTLGALYSFLQFLAAPFWGVISDKIGRRSVLLVSVAGLALSYLIWFFSGSFTLIVIARIIGGLMGGNISTATAVVADITTRKNRSKGMAFVGIAFAFGFIIGPAIGGLLCLIDFTQIFPESKAIGVNPFSAPALFAFLLSVINVIFIFKKLPETRKESENNDAHVRTSNPIKLFKPLPYPGINLTNFGHFLFLFAFSGMEFTLTFLAVDRLSYTSLDNGIMFIYIGFVLAMIQGGVVRRKANDVGEKKMALAGLVIIIPGLAILASAYSGFMLYLGLTFLATGSAMAIPCLTTLISLYSPVDVQGQAIGIFRSLGALARVFGPFIAAIIYWKFGPASAYYLGSAFLIFPIILISRLPKTA
jgi:ferrochelatase